MLLQKGYTLFELMIVLAIIGIIASLAIPTYQDYVARSQALEAFNMLGGMRSAVIVEVAQDPSAYTCAIPAKSVTSGRYVESVVAQWNPPNCDLVATFYNNAGVAQSIRGKNVILRFDTITGFFVTGKAATNFTLPQKYVPSAWQ